MLFKALFSRRSPWVDRLAGIAQCAGDLLREHSLYCLVGAFRIDDGQTSRLLIELRGDLRDLDPALFPSLKALLVHGLNKKLQLGLTGASMVLAISGEDIAELPALKAASMNVLHRGQARAAVRPKAARPTGSAPAVPGKPPVEITEFGESGWTLFAATMQVPQGSSSRFGELPPT